MKYWSGQEEHEHLCGTRNGEENSKNYSAVDQVERYMSGIKEFEFKARGYSGSRTKLRRRAGGTGSGGRSLGKTSWYSGGKRKTTTITRGRD